MNVDRRIGILNALIARYEAQHIDEVDKQLQKIAEAEEKLQALQSFKI